MLIVCTCTICDCYQPAIKWAGPRYLALSCLTPMFHLQSHIQPKTKTMMHLYVYKHPPTSLHNNTIGVLVTHPINNTTSIPRPTTNSPALQIHDQNTSIMRVNLRRQVVPKHQHKLPSPIPAYPLLHQPSNSRLDLRLMILRMYSLSSDDSQLLQTTPLALCDGLFSLLNRFFHIKTMQVNCPRWVLCVVLGKDPVSGLVVQLVLVALVLLALLAELLCTSAVA